MWVILEVPKRTIPVCGAPPMLPGRLSGLLPLHPVTSLVVTRAVVGRSVALMLCLKWWEVLDGTPR